MSATSFDFELDIKRSSRRKSIAIIIKNGQVCVRAPSFLPQQQIVEFVERKKHWITKNLQQPHNIQEKPSYSEGSELPILDSSLLLTIADGQPSKAEQVNDELIIRLSSRVKNKEAKIESLINEFYQSSANNYLHSRINQLSMKVGLLPNTVKVKGFKARWGSCDYRGNILLNWRLMRVPAVYIDYVIVHELCHLTHMNHSSQFWQLVEQHYPAARKAKRWFRENGNALLY